MGRATSLVGPELRARVYDRAVKERDIYVLYDKPFGDGTHLLEIVSDKLGYGYQGQQDIVIENGELRFTKDCDV